MMGLFNRILNAAGNVVWRRRYERLVARIAAEDKRNQRMVDEYLEKNGRWMTFPPRKRHFIKIIRNLDDDSIIDIQDVTEAEFRMQAAE